MTIDDLRTMLDYQYWARDRMLDAIEKLSPADFTKDLSSSFKSVRDTAVHILGAEMAWYKRWHLETFTSLPAVAADFPDVATLRRVWLDHESKMRAFLETIGEAGMNRVFEFRLMSGAEGKSTYAQAVQHLVNHGTYHRGQVATLLRQLGAEPPKTLDMIGYFRERS